MDYKWLIGVGLASTGSFISNLGVTLQKLHHIQSSSARAKAQHAADGTTSTQKLVVDGVASPSKSKALAVAAHATLPLSTVALSVNGSGGSSSSSAVAPLSPGADEKANYHKGTLWRVGLGLVIFGSFADFFALSFAPQSLIAPLGSLTLVSNVIFAPLLLKEKITARDLIATVVIVAGSVLAVSFASHEDVIYSIPELFSFYFRWPFLFYITGVLAYMGALYAFIRHMEHLEMQLQLLPHLINTDSRYLGYDRLRTLLRFAYPSISGAVGAQSVLFAKCTAELLMNTSTGNGFLFAHFQTYLVLGGMGLTIFLQIKWLNDGLRRFPASYTVPVFTAFWILLSVMSGLVFYNEYAGMHNFQMGMFAVGVLLTVAGVVTLSQRAVEEDFSEPEPAIEEEDVTDDEDALSVRLPETASVDGLIRHFSSLGSRTGTPGMVGAGPSPVATAGGSIGGRPRSSSGSTTHNLSISVKVDNATGRLTTTVLSPTVNASAASSPNALVLSSA